VFVLSEQGSSESVTTSHRGQIQFQGADRFLVLDQGQRNEVNKDSGEKVLARFEQYRVLVDSQTVRTDDELPPKALNSLDLLNKPTASNLAELTWRLGLFFGAFNLMLLGVGMSATDPRRASNWNLLFALLTFVVYYNLINLSQSWVANKGVSMWEALAGLHGGALALALALIWWRDNANRLCLQRSRPSPSGSVTPA